MLPTAPSPMPVSQIKPPLLYQTEENIRCPGLGKAHIEASRNLSTNFRKNWSKSLPNYELYPTWSLFCYCFFVFFKLELKSAFSRKSTAKFSSCATCTSNTAKCLDCHALLQLPQTSMKCFQLSPLLQEGGGRSQTWLDTWSKRELYSAACQCSRKLKQGWMAIWRSTFSSCWTSSCMKPLWLLVSFWC